MIACRLYLFINFLISMERIFLCTIFKKVSEHNSQIDNMRTSANRLSTNQLISGQGRRSL